MPESDSYYGGHNGKCNKEGKVFGDEHSFMRETIWSISGRGPRI